MRVLAIDTSSETACVGVVVDGVVRAEESARVSAQHGETLLTHVARVLASAGLEKAAIELVAVGLGPGSFTGVRIGLATAKGLALGLARPIVGVRTSEALAAAVEGARRVVAIDAKKGEVFASLWAADGDALAPLLEDVNGPPAAVASSLAQALDGAEATLVGTGARAYPELASALVMLRAADAAHDVVRAGALAQRATLAFARRGPDALATLEPVYVRPADALLPGAR